MRVDPEAAPAVFRLYQDLTSTVDRALLSDGDARLGALETWVHGLVQLVCGDVQGALGAFESVVSQAKRFGCQWQVVQALLEIDCVYARAGDRNTTCMQQAADLIHEHFPRSYLAARLGWWASVYRDPIAMSLSPRQRELLRHYLCGRTMKEIAAEMAISVHTVKEYTKILLRKFSVGSATQLLVACYQRGIGTPSWWDALDSAGSLRVAENGRRRYAAKVMRLEKVGVRRSDSKASATHLR